MVASGGDRGVRDAWYRRLFAVLAEHSDAYVSCVDRARRIHFHNRTLSRSLSELLGSRMDDFLAPDCRDQVVAGVERAFSSREAQRLEYEVLLKDSARRYMNTCIVPFSGPDGEDLALLLTRDVTDRRHLMGELEKSLEFRRRVVENLPDLVALVNEEQQIVWANRAPSGSAHSDLGGRPLEDFFPSLISVEALEATQAAIARALDSGVGAQYEACAPGGGGEPDAWYLIRTVPAHAEGKTANVLLICSDITEGRRLQEALREAEDRLHKAQQLQSLGDLAGGIAHDFNNLIQVIAGNVSVAQESVERGVSPREELEQALCAAGRAAELTSRLLAVGRRKHLELKTVDLWALVEHSLRMLRSALPENITLQRQAPMASCFVRADAPHFEQVLLNLCVNARDAMPEGGTLSVGVEPSDPCHVVVCVRDTGVGIAPADLPRVFEPFFTTKGTGSGLGLAAAVGIVEAHGGAMVAESTVGRGTSMSIRLPRASPEPQAQERAVERANGSCTILIAEDADLIRAQTVRTLERAGYSVLQAENGVQAVEAFRANRNEAHLLILDVIMPELDGWQAYLQIARLCPNVKVLFTTGYAGNALPDDLSQRGARLLSKPYTSAVLLEHVRELLGSHVPPPLT